MTSNETTPMRRLMPSGYLAIIAQMTGATRSNISVTVNDENIRSRKIWWAIEQLAREFFPEKAEQRIAYLKQKHQIS